MRRALVLPLLCLCAPLAAVLAACGSSTLTVAQNGSDSGTPVSPSGADGGNGRDAAAPPSSCTGLLPLRRSLPAGAGTNAIAIVDLDRDGRLDVVATNGGASSLSVFLGSGSGDFAAGKTYGAGPTPYWVAAADLSGDGLPDLAVANDVAPGTAQVLLNQGAGAVAPAVSYPVGAGPQSLGIADFNGDAKPDVLVCNGDDGTATLLLAEGAGVLAAQPALLTVGAVTVAVGDFDGDHHEDAAIVGLNAVSVLLGKGDGTFQAAVSYPAGQLASFVTAADLDGDGHLDLAVTNEGDNTVSVLLGAANGTFGAQAAYPTGPSPAQVVAADLDGDGRLDLAVAGNKDGNVSVLLGRASGGFAAAQSLPSGATSLWGIAAADLDGDGRPDLAAADVKGGQVRLLLTRCGLDGGTPPAPPTDASSRNDATSNAPFACGTSTCNPATEFCNVVWGSIANPDTYTCTPLPTACGPAPTCACASLPQCGAATCTEAQGLITVRCEVG